MANSKQNKATFAQLMDALVVLCRADKNGAIFGSWLTLAVGSFEDAHTYLPQVIARTDSPVVAMLARQALKAR